MPYDLPLAEAAAALALGFVACLAFAGRVRRQNLAFGLGLLVVVLLAAASRRFGPRSRTAAAERAGA